MMPMKSASIWKSMSSACRLYVGMAGHRRRDAAVEIAAGGGVGVPELVLRVLERLAVVGGRGVEADACP